MFDFSGALKVLASLAVVGIVALGSWLSYAGWQLIKFIFSK